MNEMQNAECKMQKESGLAEQFCILHSAFCIRAGGAL